VTESRQWRVTESRQWRVTESRQWRVTESRQWRVTESRQRRVTESREWRVTETHKHIEPRMNADEYSAALPQTQDAFGITAETQRRRGNTKRQNRRAQRGQRALSRQLLRCGAAANDFLTSAISVSLRLHCSKRSLPPPQSRGLTSICFSQRLGVSAVNIPWLRLRRAVFVCGYFSFGLRT
jgi:hypothetical protein